jgi:amino acid transporter
MAGWLQFVSSGVDACIYPGLFLVYLEQALDMDLEDPVTQWTVKIGFVAAMLALNFAGIQSVGHGSTAFMVILLTPFVVIVLIAFTGVFTGTTILGWPFSTENMLGTKPAAEVDWPAFLMVMLWNMGYWEGASVCAGEVADIGRVFPQAIAITMGVVLLNYILPIMAFSGLDGDYAAFDNGHYIAVARNVCGEYFGWALGLAQTVSVCGLFAQGVLKNTYLVCGMAEQGMLPTALAARMPYTNSPYVALMATTIILILIMPLRTFKTILGVDIDLYCLALLLEIGAFIRLRSTQPDRPREYRIPVDGVWVYLVFIPAIIITVAGVVLGGWLEFMVMIAFIAGGIVVILILHVLRDTKPEWFSLAEGVSDVMGAAAYTRVETQEPASAP